MGASNSILSYEHESGLLEKALQTSKGLRLTFNSEKLAIVFVHRCNKFRVLDRKRNEKIYIEPAHDMHGSSVYDRLMIRRDGAIVKIEVMDHIEAHAEIEELE